MATKENTIKKTFKELKDIDIMVGNMYQKTPTLKDSKFGYAYKRFAEKNFYPINKEYIQALTDIRIDHALVNEGTKELLIDPNPNSRGFKYGKEGLKAVTKAETVLENAWDIKECEVEPYIVKKEDLPTLSDVALELFSGVLIK